jgi:hypothetical protein
MGDRNRNRNPRNPRTAALALPPHIPILDDMSASFPATLVGYEIAVMEALRRELGADLARLPQPETREIGEAFFRKTPPLDYAWQWMEQVQARKAQAPAEKKAAQDDGTLSLL